MDLHRLLRRRVRRHVQRRLLFFHTANVFYIWAHFFGAVFVGLFVCLEWELSSFRWLFTLFSLFPALSEIVIGFLVLQMNILQYK